ncbi:hypothetical protein HYFRA_00004458 [Hymenoscyphus fraxineus]|uniref:Uncharacterized protein n=1 Tax=Hymenoscyphus fraxineus TaxID=746836 RepID=A0A9N9KXC3_9HELO|nr:hypothetical protein HYFRA_00004458 [Hymenoscyphus fraxineus]
MASSLVFPSQMPIPTGGFPETATRPQLSREATRIILQASSFEIRWMDVRCEQILPTLTPMSDFDVRIILPHPCDDYMILFSFVGIKPMEDIKDFILS